MRDVWVWKIVRLSSIAIGSAFMLSACISCINTSAAVALALPVLGTVQTVATDATTTLKTVVTLPQKAAPSPIPVASAPTMASPSTQSQPTATAAKSSPVFTAATLPSDDRAAAVTASQPAISGYNGEAFDDGLTQPFVVADTVSWPYGAAFTTNAGLRLTATHTAFIEPTPEGWRIGGVLWYWWMGLLGLIAVAIHERAHLMPRRLKYEV